MPAVPEWSKLGHAGVITWMVHLSDYSFDLFKRDFITRVSVDREHVCTHLRKLELEGNKIQWRCTIHNNLVFGVARNTAVTSEEEWLNFVTEVACNPGNEVKVKITMQDPSVLEKQAAAFTPARVTANGIVRPPRMIHDTPTPARVGSDRAKAGASRATTSTPQAAPPPIQPPSPRIPVPAVSYWGDPCDGEMAPISQPRVPINARVGVPIRSESPQGLPDVN
ncbi:hypothetical protein PtA15_9A550 [Puccinia triticina]|uniref:Uncharacterized protein n=1 Tax=Puccinia triticina TaxID=208348 RepID=A0ABY7CVQ6_9BASI|nr:uncharacterized protein PtA15_9A550 [Puccinia triticina]WAQ88423.1 hypothetical protein PtA15_9A550 [Puccinia triticina]